MNTIDASKFYILEIGKCDKDAMGSEYECYIHSILALNFVSINYSYYSIVHFKTKTNKPPNSNNKDIDT